MQHNQATNASYGQLAPYYDALFGRTAQETFERGIAKQISSSSILSGKALDIGSGTGLSQSWLADVGRFDLYGVEPSAAMRLRSAIPADKHVQLPLTTQQKEVLSGCNLAFSNFDTLNLLDLEELKFLLLSLNELASPSLTLIFDLIDPVGFSDTMVALTLGEIVCELRTIRTSNELAVSEVVLQRHGRIISRTSQTHFLHERADIQKLASECDWTVQADSGFTVERDGVPKRCVTMQRMHP